MPEFGFHLGPFILYFIKSTNRYNLPPPRWLRNQTGLISMSSKDRRKTFATDHRRMAEDPTKKDGAGKDKNDGCNNGNAGGS